MASNQFFWKKTSWEEKKKDWEEKSLQYQRDFPIRTLKTLPNMPGIHALTAKHLKWKSLKYMIKEDVNKKIIKSMLKHPIKYSYAFLASLFKKKSYTRQGDLFFYGAKTMDAFKEVFMDKKSRFILGFSYCHKPFECPSGRFSDQCINDSQNPVCGQCFIGKSIALAPKDRLHLFIIPTIHYIGEKVFEVVHQYPNIPISFIITACEMTLKMFGDWGNMVKLKGIGIRLDGRICNTMRAFELSEKGIKPGLTTVLPSTQEQVLALLAERDKILTMGKNN